LAAASGPLEPDPVSPGNRNDPRPRSDSPRVVAFGPAEIVPEQTNRVPVTLAASGEENAVAFSVRFDPAVLRFVDATNGAASAKATLNINSKKAADGIVGIAMALGTGAKFTPGTIEVANLRFAVVPGAKGGTNLRFGDIPIFREVASPLADALPATWTDAAVGILPVAVAAALETSAQGPVVIVSWPDALAGAVLESSDAPTGAAWTPVVGSAGVAGGRVTLKLSAGQGAGYFRLRLP
jgi:hypothetical protein